MSFLLITPLLFNNSMFVIKKHAAHSPLFFKIDLLKVQKNQR